MCNCTALYNSRSTRQSDRHPLSPLPPNLRKLACQPTYFSLKTIANKVHCTELLLYLSIDILLASAYNTPSKRNFM